MRKPIVTAGLFLMAAAATVAAENGARACGGCFGPSETPTVVTDHRMILSISSQQTTLYDQIRYQGAPSSFAWVLPINGQATVGLSADALFTVLDGASQTQVIAPPPDCPAPPPGCAVPPSGFGGASNGAADAGAVTVSHQQVVGPYETVQLHSTDANALNDWLTSHGYAIPTEVQPVIAAYVNEHFDFLALKLVPGTNVTAMRPVRVTTAGASPVLPLRMVAAGAGATVGVTLWVVADGRYETQNFPWFHIADSELVWNWDTQRSNFTELRATKEAAGGGKAWELESSTTQSLSQIQSSVRYASELYQPGTSSPEYPPIPADDAGNPGKTSQQEYDDDMATLFGGIGQQNGEFRLTRMRADLGKTALATDLDLVASSDQGVLSNIRRPQAQTGTPQCPTYECGGPVDNGGSGGGTSNGGTTGSTGATGSVGGGASTFSCAVEPSANGKLYSVAGIFAASLLALASARRRRNASTSRNG